MMIQPNKMGRLEKMVPLVNMIQPVAIGELQKMVQQVKNGVTK